MAYDLPKTVLSKLLSALKHTPERLSAQETDLAARIVHCTICDNLWVRRKKKQPERCPHCHKRGWDRPLITALLQAEKGAE